MLSPMLVLVAKNLVGNTHKTRPDWWSRGTQRTYVEHADKTGQAYIVFEAEQEESENESKIEVEDVYVKVAEDLKHLCFFFCKN